MFPHDMTFMDKEFLATRTPLESLDPGNPYRQFVEHLFEMNEPPVHVEEFWIKQPLRAIRTLRFHFVYTIAFSIGGENYSFDSEFEIYDLNQILGTYELVSQWHRVVPNPPVWQKRQIYIRTIDGARLNIAHLPYLLQVVNQKIADISSLTPIVR